MLSNVFKIFSLVVLCLLMCFSFMTGCKNTDTPLGHQGPFDVPTNTSTITATSTITNTPTATPTPGPVNVSCYVNYGGSQLGVSWNLVDPNGNTVNLTAQSSGGTPFLFTLSTYGTYSVNIPTQTKYLYSSQPLTITGPGNYSVTFTCSGQALSVNPTSFNYASTVGNQTPVTVSYSYSGNLDIPVSIQTSGLDSSFSVLPSYVILSGSSLSAPLTVTKNSCDLSNTSLNFSANDLLGGTTGITSNISINRGYLIPVNFYYSYSGAVTVTTPSILSDVSGSVTYTISCTDSSLSCAAKPYTASYGQSTLSPYGQSFGSSGSNSFGQGSSMTFSFNWNYAFANASTTTNSVPITVTLPNSTQMTGNISFNYASSFAATSVVSDSGTLFSSGSY